MKNSEDNYFFEAISAGLKDENLTALAKKLDIPKALLFDWVKGRRMPSLRNSHYVKKLADYLDMSFEEVVLGPQESTTKRTIGSVFFSDQEREYLVQIKRIK